jgi:hypothetical protein
MMLCARLPNGMVAAQAHGNKGAIKAATRAPEKTGQRAR